jgi:predicted Fe-Mo cluster-binding NifX family protein
VEPRIPAAELQFHGAQRKQGAGRCRVLIFVSVGQEERREVEVVAEEKGQQANGVGGWAGKEVFKQGEAVFAEADGVYARYR